MTDRECLHGLSLMENDDLRRQDDQAKMSSWRLNWLIFRLSNLRVSDLGKIVFVASLLIFVIVLSVYSLYFGINVVFPHLFYLPIVFVAYWFPKYGIPFAAAIALFYTAEFAIFNNVLHIADNEQWPWVFARDLIYVLVGSALTLLRWETFTLSGVMEEKDRFTYLRHRKNGYIYFSPSFSKIFGNVSSKKLKDEGIECFLEEGDKERFRTAEVETLQGERK